jgi:hypothetical protein
MAFHPAICTTIKRLFTKILTPNWIDHLSKVIYIPIVTPVMKETREAFASLHSHMLEVVSQARAQFADGKGSSLDAALLRNLVHANMNQEEGSSKHLSDDELLSNTFVSHSTRDCVSAIILNMPSQTFFLAGHGILKFLLQ